MAHFEIQVLELNDGARWAFGAETGQFGGETERWWTDSAQSWAARSVSTARLPIPAPILSRPVRD